MTREEFMTAYIIQRAGALATSVDAAKLVKSAAKVWQEMQYEFGHEERPAPVIEHDEDGVVLEPQGTNVTRLAFDPELTDQV